VRCRPADKAVEPLLSDEHFWVDGTLIEAWASMKSLQPKAEASGAEPPAGEAGSADKSRRMGRTASLSAKEFKSFS